jgi:hypothetical protein
LLNIDIINEEA